MHIPDGFLEPKVWLPLTFLSGGAVLVSSKKVGKNMDEKLVPLMGVLAAFVFAAQMINFPIGGGTSGHLMGGLLIAAIVGPYAAVLILTTILILQALLFQDGGITAIGANIFNMAIAGTVSGYIIFSIVRLITGNIKIAAFLGSWSSVVAASTAAAIELSLSGVVPMKLSISAMAGVHSIIGLGEGIITVAAIGLVSRVSKDCLYGSAVPAETGHEGKRVWIWLAVSLAVAALLAPFASELPDGLEKVAERLGFMGKEVSQLTSPLPDYGIPGMDGRISAAVAGLIGVLATFAVAYSIARLIHRRR